MKTKEQFKTLKYTSPKKHQTITLEVGDRGTIKYDGNILKPFSFNKSHGYHYVRACGSFKGMLLVHRLVALAWVKGKSRTHCFVDHINSKRRDNRALNLRWTTRKMNNTSQHAQKMRKKNSHYMKHSNELIKATKGDEVKYFTFGRYAAQYIGCSKVLVYRVLNPEDWAKKAKGWTLEYVPADSVEITAKED